MDRQPPDLAPEGSSDRVADRGLDLAGDLRDRHAVGDRQVQLDLKRVPRRTRMPGLAESEPAEKSLERPAGEAGHAVRAERRPSGPDRRRPGGSRAIGRASGSVWHAGDPPRGLDRDCVRTLGGVGGRVLFYRSVRARPGPRHSNSDHQRTTHGPFLRDLRQGIDGRLQPAVVGDEPRPSPPTHAAEPSAARHRREGHPDEGARLHPLPAHPAQGGEVRRPRTARSGVAPGSALPGPAALGRIGRPAWPGPSAGALSDSAVSSQIVNGPSFDQLDLPSPRPNRPVARRR